MATIKAYLLAGLSLALAVMYALFNREKAKRYKEQAKSAKAGIKTLTKANEAIADAEKRGRDRLENIDTSKRDHFK